MSEDFDAGTAPLVWHGEYPPAIVEAVRSDLAVCLGGLGAASDLGFHHVFLSDDMDGPCVMVWGEIGSDALHCEYHAAAVWGPLSALDEAAE